ncbi:MAG: hypothetical protein ATN36_06970 [Epulopiscium sp. Nele67-Bin005]|nr:MAG: hypothetical protein ATN36_06970 [Epulopiscium sp. Nele67-Bin005]
MHIEAYSNEVKPYEKFKKYGVNGLTDVELIAILLRTGTKNKNVFEISKQLLTDREGNCDLRQLANFTHAKLTLVEGLGDVKAMQLLAVVELSMRLNQLKSPTKVEVTKPDMIAKLLMTELRWEKQEHFYVILLDTKCQIIAKECISKGSLNSTIVHPREVFKVAIDCMANSIIVAHNHPSGDPEPSKEDKNITKRLLEVGSIVGIPLLDHIIIGDGTFRSLKSEMGF